MCDSTVASQSKQLPLQPPRPCFSGILPGNCRGGCRGFRRGGPPGHPLTPWAPKTAIITSLQGAKDVSSFCPGLPYIMHLSCNAKGDRQTQSNNPPPQTKNNPNKNATDRHETNQTDQRMTTTRKKKKQVRGLRLDVVAEQGVRIEDEERVQQEENTRGNPNPKRGLGFPST